MAGCRTGRQGGAAGSDAQHHGQQPRLPQPGGLPGRGAAEQGGKPGATATRQRRQRLPSHERSAERRSPWGERIRDVLVSEHQRDAELHRAAAIALLGKALTPLSEKF